MRALMTARRQIKQTAIGVVEIIYFSRPAPSIDDESGPYGGSGMDVGADARDQRSDVNNSDSGEERRNDGILSIWFACVDYTRKHKQKAVKSARFH
ncbi:hypothetical protein GWI33_018034 [Rhynchophorus ferrugineus]|uniref:Uncharacterized protein n=1 Tax=Rhynchophorus ferrugineus TaxID=354439 RepID=A0A834HU94_RHYFE|nr:hypothetical protein GWI33_018034 [Rhynchophorus ferrugineus]